MKYLKAFPKGQKSLVFSQFCKFLDAIEPHLARADIRAVRFDGSMSAAARAKILNDFQKPVSGKSAHPFSAGKTNGKGKTARQESDSSATEISDDDVKEINLLKKPPSRKAKGKRRAKVVETDYEDGSDGTEDEQNARADTRPTVMLISLKSGSVGINLTAAQVCTSPHCDCKTMTDAPTSRTSS